MVSVDRRTIICVETNLKASLWLALRYLRSEIHAKTAKLYKKGVAFKHG